MKATQTSNKNQHNQALRALDSQQVARLCGGRYCADEGYLILNGTM
ncbi:hypothetical protein QWZ13_18125 [Reinekea marina]|nr:hypothetical protein [Reinekea marina]MDN3650828.1 hypothetical protein [Reinekea marina]